jgi:hypothetical protein
MQMRSFLLYRKWIRERDAAGKAVVSTKGGKPAPDAKLRDTSVSICASSNAEVLGRATSKHQDIFTPEQQCCALANRTSAF